MSVAVGDKIQAGADKLGNKLSKEYNIAEDKADSLATIIIMGGVLGAATIIGAKPVSEAFKKILNLKKIKWQDSTEIKKHKPADESVKHDKFNPEVKQKLTDILQKGNADDIIKEFEKNAGWKLDKETFAKVPDHLKSEAKLAKSFNSKTDPNPGVRFLYKKQDDLRIMKGTPGAEHPSQQKDYVKIVSNGKTILRDGRAITEKDFPKPSFHPDAHIPVEEWKTWKEWNKK